jgi:acetyl-CoA carboxylase biotin carboxyl carrier protein
MSLTPDDVRDIVRVLDSSTVDELHVETADLSITLRRGDTAGVWGAETRVMREPHPLRTVEPSVHPAPPAGTPPPAADPTVGVREGLQPILPPLLGTFYRAPKPGAPPFVEVGTQVAPDTVIGIVETMKMMNSIYAGVSGVVAEICLGDGQFADADTVLMLVEADL